MTGSRAAFGTKRPVLDCSHVQYFLQPPVRAELRDFLTLPAPVVLSVTSEIIKGTKTIIFRSFSVPINKLERIEKLRWRSDRCASVACIVDLPRRSMFTVCAYTNACSLREI